MMYFSASLFTVSIFAMRYDAQRSALGLLVGLFPDRFLTDLGNEKPMLLVYSRSDGTRVYRQPESYIEAWISND